MTRRKFLIGNWKMHKTIAEARSFAEQLGRQTTDLPATVDYAVCAPFTVLHVLTVTLPTRVALGAQNLYFEPKGAFTGEISGPMLAEAGARLVIVGHSERRQLFGETDDSVEQKVRAVVDANLTPVLCVGEDRAERIRHQTLAVVERQTVAGLRRLHPQEVATTVVAYEPVWAIGSGETPTPEQAEAIIAHIRTVIRREHGETAATTVRMLYGGSVKPDNVAAFTEQQNIDGALVGGASLEASSFVRLAVGMAGAGGDHQ